MKKTGDPMLPQNRLELRLQHIAEKDAKTGQPLDYEFGGKVRGVPTLKIKAHVPLDYYLNRKWISDDEHRAGDTLFKAFKFSGQTPGVTLNLDPTRGGKKDFTWAQQTALDDWRNAMNSVSGTIGQLMVWKVCCQGHFLSDHRYPPYNAHNAMTRLREALQDLCKFYAEKALS